MARRSSRAQSDIVRATIPSGPAMYSATIGGRRFTFRDLKTLLAKATPLRSGDQLAGLAAETGEERVAAQFALADLPLYDILDEPVVPYETDEVTRLIIDSHDRAAFAPIAHLTVGGFRDWLLSDEATTPVLAALAPGVTPEMAAAVSKISRLQDLMVMAAKCSVVTRFRNTIGLPGRLSVRLQPNHPTDDARGIAASILDGLLLGSGDAVIGINPATDSPERAHRCCRCSTTSGPSSTSRRKLRAGPCHHHARADPQRLAGRSGVPVDRRHGGRQQKLRHRSGAAEGGPRGGAVASPRHHRRQRDVFRDRARQRAVGQRASRRRPADAGGARLCGGAAFKPLLVNTVVGFIGPEYLFDGKQIIRAGLEDHFCGKLLGVPMGVDVCYTNHAEADQDDMDALLTLLVAAGVNFVMGVPGADDIMLGYQSTSFHDALAMRDLFGGKPAPEFEAWLERQGLMDSRNRIRPRELPGHFRALLPGLSHDR